MTGDRSVWESPPPCACARACARARVGREGTGYPSPVTQVWKSASAMLPGPLSRVTDAWGYPSPGDIRHPQSASAASGSVVLAGLPTARASRGGALCGAQGGQRG